MVFGTYGFSKSTVQEIAATALVSKPLFYRQFKNKQDVFEAVIEQVRPDGLVLDPMVYAGAIAAHRIGAGRVVTVSMREVVFKHPVRVGDIVSCYSDVIKTGRTSITVTVRVVAHRPADPKYAVDFRSVYATILQKWLQSNPEKILGQEFPLLDLI